MDLRAWISASDFESGGEFLQAIDLYLLLALQRAGASRRPRTLTQIPGTLLSANGSGPTQSEGFYNA